MSRRNCRRWGGDRGDAGVGLHVLGGREAVAVGAEGGDESRDERVTGSGGGSEQGGVRMRPGGLFELRVEPRDRGVEVGDLCHERLREQRVRFDDRGSFRQRCSATRLPFDRSAFCQTNPQLQRRLDRKLPSFAQSCWCDKDPGLRVQLRCNAHCSGSGARDGPQND